MLSEEALESFALESGLRLRDTHSRKKGGSTKTHRGGDSSQNPLGQSLIFQSLPEQRKKGRTTTISPFVSFAHSSLAPMDIVIQVGLVPLFQGMFIVALDQGI